METLPCQGCKVLCCGPVPVTAHRKPEAAAAANWSSKEKHVGILSQDFTWKDFK